MRMKLLENKQRILHYISLKVTGDELLDIDNDFLSCIECMINDNVEINKNDTDDFAKEAADIIKNYWEYSTC